MFNQIKTASQLKSFAESGQDSHFFDRDTLKFFGDKMSNYGIRHLGIINGVWTIELFRRKPVKHGVKTSAYFAQTAPDACKRVFLKSEVTT